MYVTKLMREKNRERYSTQGIEVFSSIEPKVHPKTIHYQSVSNVSMNVFVKEIFVKYNPDDTVKEAYYIGTNNEIHEIVLKDFYEIMGGDTPNIKVTRDGAIIVFNKDKLIVTLDFSNYQLINISELREVGRFYGDLEDIEENNFIFYDRNYNDKKRIPFTIETNFASQASVVILYLDKEFE